MIRFFGLSTSRRSAALILSGLIFASFSAANGEIATDKKRDNCATYVYEQVCRLFSLKANKRALTSEEQEKGVSLKTLADWFAQDGFEVEAIRCDFADLDTNRAVYVAHVNNEHYMVISQKRHGDMLIFDGSPVQTVLSEQKFLNMWDGLCLKISSQKASISRPAIAFESSAMSLGRKGLSEGGVVTTRIFNTSESAPLSLQKISASCGCVAPTLEKEKLAPGESANLTINFVGKGMPGEIREKVVLESDDPNQPASVIGIGGIIVATNEFLPKIVNFGRLEKGVFAQRNVRFLNEKDFQISKKLDVKLDQASGFPGVVISADCIGNVLAIRAELTSYNGEILPGMSDGGFIKSTLKCSIQSDDGVSKDILIPICAILPR